MATNQAQANPFDQFDGQAQAVASQPSQANPFDQFDAQQPGSLPTVTVHAPARLPGILGDINDFGNDMGDAFAHHLGNLAFGSAQLVGHGITAAADAALSPTNSVRQSLDATNANADNSIQQREANYQQNVPTNTASVIGAGLGEALPFALDAPVKALGYIGDAAKFLPEGVSALGTLGNTILSGAAQGATVGALQPVTSPQGDGSYAAQKAGQIGVGMLAGGGGAAVLGAPALAGKLLLPTADPVAQQLAKTAATHGIDITGPQLSSSVPLKTINSVTSQAPFSGAQAFADKQQGQFTNAVARTIGLPEGTTKVTPDVFAGAKQQASNGFNQLWANNHLQVTPDLINNVNNAFQDVAQVAGPDAARSAQAMLTRLNTAASESGGVVPGNIFQSVDSQLGKMAAQPGVAGHYIGELQDTLRQGMQSGMTPQDAANLQELRGQWRNILDLTPIIAKTTTGDIPPAALMGAITRNGVGKASMSVGARGDIGDLAQIGQRFLKSQTPDSFTSSRNAYIGALKGAGTVGGAVTNLPATAGALGASRAVQQVMRSRALYNALANQAQSDAPAGQNALGRVLPALTAQQFTQPPQNALSGK